MKKKTTAVLVLLLLLIAGTAGVLICSQIQRRSEPAAQEEQDIAEKEQEQDTAGITAAAGEQEETETEQDSPEETGKAETEPSEEAVAEEPEEGAAEEAAIQAPEGTAGGEEGMTDLKGELESFLAGCEGDWSVYVRNLADETYLEINSHAVKAASLIKLYIMGAVLEQIEAGTLQEDEQIRQLLRDMITVSDNESSNELVRRLSPDGTSHEEGMKVVNAFAQEGGYYDTSQGRDLRDYREVPAEGENYTSVRDCGLLLERVYSGTCVSAQASARMLELLKQQTRTWKIPAGVPEGVVTANKTGELSDTENDAAIVYGPGGDYILCVTSTGLADAGTAQQNIVTISGMVYAYLNQEAS